MTKEMTDGRLSRCGSADRISQIKAVPSFLQSRLENMQTTITCRQRFTLTLLHWIRLTGIVWLIFAHRAKANIQKQTNESTSRSTSDPLRRPETVGSPKLSQKNLRGSSSCFMEDGYAERQFLPAALRFQTIHLCQLSFLSISKSRLRSNS